MKFDFLKKYRLLSLIILDVLIIIAFAQGTLGLYQNNKLMSQEISDERARQELILHRGVEIANENWKIEFGGVNKEAIAGSFIPKEEILGFITTLESMADKRGLQSELDLPDFNPNAEGLQQISLRISVNGSYAGVMRYMRDIERLNYYIHMSDVDLTYQPSPLLADENDAGGVHLVINALIFWYGYGS